MRDRTLKYIAMGIGVIALLVSLNGLFNKNWFLGIGGIVICILLIVLSLRIKPQIDKISLHEVVEAYKKYLEQFFRISLPKDVKIFHFDENDKNYIIVLTYLNKEDNQETYFPFEVDKYNGDFGRGAGQFMDDIRDIEFWVNKYDKTYKASEEIAKRMSDKISKKIRDELDYYYYGEQGGNEDGEAKRTEGG